MSVLIAHASCDENGKACGGLAGDQTGREVCVRTWYAAGWNKLIRAKDSNVAERMAKFAEQIAANSKIGYDQWNRNSLRSVAKAAGWDGSKITTACETDCSAFMTVCAEAAGINMDSTYTSLGNGVMNAPVTQNMCSKFKATGAFDVLTLSKYFSTDVHLLRGDILVRESGHTAMAVTNGSAAKAENGTVTPQTASGIKAGDIIYFSGGKHYASASATSGVSVGPGSAKVTYIIAGALHPYHIIHTDSESSVYGWVDANTIKTVEPTNRTHKIVWGDTLWGIANRYGVKLDDLLELNGLTKSSIILPGKTLKIPG